MVNRDDIRHSTVIRQNQTCLGTNYSTCTHYSMIFDLIPVAQLFLIAVPLATYHYTVQDGIYKIGRLVQQQQLGNSDARP